MPDETTEDRLLGGQVRDKVRAYNTDIGWLSVPDQQLVEGALRAVDQGFTGIKIKVGSTVERDLHRRADIVIGDRFGTSCMAMISDVVEQSLTGAGYKVARNRPFAGGFITEHYGQPKQGLHAIQIEINRALYMDERTYQLHRSFMLLQDDMQRMAAALADAVAASSLATGTQSGRLAAE